MSYLNNNNKSMNYKFITPQTNNVKCKYVCHAGLYNDMGHATAYCDWENKIKPSNYLDYEENIKNIVYSQSYKFVKDVIVQPPGSQFSIMTFEPKQKVNKWANIVRFYINGDTFVRIDFNKI